MDEQWLNNLKSELAALKGMQATARPQPAAMPSRYGDPAPQQYTNIPQRIAALQKTVDEYEKSGSSPAASGYGARVQQAEPYGNAVRQILTGARS